MNENLKTLSFNSLQTGRSFRTIDKVTLSTIDKTSFNSLQTGRSFRTVVNVLHIESSNEEFQFPSNGKVFPNTCVIDHVCVVSKFQFPSNGKVFPNVCFRHFRHRHFRVSIPFKREGLSELSKMFQEIHKILEFQFPSNGKVFPN